MRRHPRPGAKPSRARRAARRGALLLMVLPAAVLAALVFPAASAGADTSSYVRLVQLSPDAAGTTIAISAVADPARDLVLPDQPYGVLSDYRRIEPGDYVVAVRSPDAGTAVVSSALKAVPGTSYTLASVGAADQRSLRVSTDDLTTPPAGRARVRVLDAAPQAPVLDVRGADGSPFSVGLAFARFSDYRTVDAGMLDLTVGAPGGTRDAVSVPVGANQVISVVLVRDGSRILAQPHVDAAGPTVVPPGPIAAGYGGAADPHGVVSECVLGAVAVAAGLASVVLSRRGRAQVGRR